MEDTDIDLEHMTEQAAKAYVDLHRKVMMGQRMYMVSLSDENDEFESAYFCVIPLDEDEKSDLEHITKSIVDNVAGELKDYEVQKDTEKAILAHARGVRGKPERIEKIDSKAYALMMLPWIAMNLVKGGYTLLVTEYE